MFTNDIGMLVYEFDGGVWNQTEKNQGKQPFGWPSAGTYLVPGGGAERRGGWGSLLYDNTQHVARF